MTAILGFRFRRPTVTVRTPEMPTRRQIDQIALIADDDPGMRDVLRSLLNEAGYTVVAARRR
jgi:hypothetical protein